MNKNLRLKAIFIVLFFFAFSHGLSSQPRITQRNSPEIPKEYSKNIQNEYRKIINLKNTQIENTRKVLGKTEEMKKAAANFYLS